MKTTIANLMQKSGVGFGTSGARGLVSAMTDSVCYSYTIGFIQHLESQGELSQGDAIAVAGDYRPSSDRIMKAVAKAIFDAGYIVINCGYIPSPAVAYYGIVKKIPAIMITGSHIPDDRNGIKFNKASGEIGKADEVGITEQIIEIDEDSFDSAGMCITEHIMPPVQVDATDLYIQRYTNFFSATALRGVSLGLYEHSTVGRDVMYTIFSALGANVTKLGFSEAFIPVDTEAIRPEDIALAKQWSQEYSFNAIISADGDCDRPLLSNEQGEWFRGDVLGVLCAEFLGVDAAATPVSCNTLVEKSGLLKKVVRTRIGSPFVISGMEILEREGFSGVVGYEANGGFLTQTTITLKGKELSPLPTRDAILPIIATIMLSINKDSPLSELCNRYPKRYTASDRLKNFPVEKSKSILASLNTGELEGDITAIENLFKEICGSVDTIDRTDGLRIVFKNSEIVHLRPSGNAPEFRCYAEAETEERAEQLAKISLKQLKEI